MRRWASQGAWAWPGRRSFRPLSSLRVRDAVREDPGSSLRARVAREDPKALDLSAFEALRCTNLMCEHVGDRCACKLALWLSRQSLPELETLSLRGNDLRFVPDSVFDLGSLRELDLAFNRIEEVPEAVARLGSLRVLDLSGNADLAAVPWDALASLPALEEVRADVAPHPGDARWRAGAGGVVARVPDPP